MILLKAFYINIHNIPSTFFSFRINKILNSPVRKLYNVNGLNKEMLRDPGLEAPADSKLILRYRMPALY